MTFCSNGWSLGAFTRLRLPGDGINGIMGAFDRIGDKLRFIQVRHEEMAAFMACAHAKFTGEVGSAWQPPDREPSIFSTGSTMRRWITRRSLPSSARPRLAWAAPTSKRSISRCCCKDVTEYVYTVSSPAAMRHVVDRAVRTAAAYRAVTCVIVPKDIQEKNAVPEPPRPTT